MTDRLRGQKERRAPQGAPRLKKVLYRAGRSPAGALCFSLAVSLTCSACRAGRVLKKYNEINKTTMRFIFAVMGKGRVGQKIFISCPLFIRGRNRQKQPKRSRGRGLLFASPLRRKTEHRNQENFCTAYAGRNGFHLKRAAGTQIEVSPICGVAACAESAFLPPVLQRRCPARPHFVRGRGAVSRSRRLVQFSKCGYEELQAGRPSANSLGK